jgi:hypothetical protein
MDPPTIRKGESRTSGPRPRRSQGHWRSWLARLHDTQEVTGSNPVWPTPTAAGISGGGGAFRPRHHRFSDESRPRRGRLRSFPTVSDRFFDAASASACPRLSLRGPIAPRRRRRRRDRRSPAGRASGPPLQPWSGRTHGRVRRRRPLRSRISTVPWPARSAPRRTRSCPLLPMVVTIPSPLAVAPRRTRS